MKQDSQTAQIRHIEYLGSSGNPEEKMLRQRAPLEDEVKDEIEAEAGMPREESAIQRELGLRYVRQLTDQFLPEVMRLLEVADRGSNHLGRRG